MNVISGWSLAAAFFSLFLAGWVWRRSPGTRMNLCAGLGIFFYAFWAFWAGFAVSAPDAGAYWSSLRPALVGSTAFQAAGSFFLLAFAGVRGRWWVWATPVLVLSLVEISLSLTGFFPIAGYRAGPWGNVGILTTQPGALALFGAAHWIVGVTEMAALTWAWVNKHSRRHRRLVYLFLGGGGLSTALGWYCVHDLWLSQGYPDLSLFSSALMVVLYAVVIATEGRLAEGDFDAHGPLLQSLDEAVLLLDPPGRIVQASPMAAKLLGLTEKGGSQRLLAEVLAGWSGLAAALEGLVRDHLPRKNLEGTVGPDRYRLTLSPTADRFDDLAFIVARLVPVRDFEHALGKYGLSDREKEVAALLLEGLSGPEIADTLGISPATVKNHLHKLFAKTSTSHRVDLVRALLTGGPEARP